MGSLDQRGDISIALLVMYPFVFILALVLILRHGLRQLGWLFLLLFANAKIIGAVLHIIAEKQAVPSKGLFIAAYAVEGAGLGPLLECTLSFLGTVGSRIIQTHPIVARLRLRLVHLLISGAMAFYIIGAVKATSNSEDTRNTASNLRKIGGILFLATFAILLIVHLLFWQVQHELTKWQKTLLKGISCAVPFLAVRVLYTVLSSFSPPSSFSFSGSSSGSDSGLAKFNSITGSWQLFLIMAVMMEFVVVSIYIFFGLRLPVIKELDYEVEATTIPSASSLPLYPQTDIVYYPPNKRNEVHGQYA